MCKISRVEAAWRRGARRRKGGEERRYVRNYASKFGKGHRRCRWRARARWVWAGAVAKYLLRPCARCSSPRPAPRRCRNRKRTPRKMCKKSKYIRLYLYSGNLTLAAMYLRRARVAGQSISAGAPALTHVCTVCDYGTKSRRGPPAALPGAGIWRNAWVDVRIAPERGDGVHCPTTARHAAFNDNMFPKIRTSKTCDGISWHAPVTQSTDIPYFILAQKRFHLNPHALRVFQCTGEKSSRNKTRHKKNPPLRKIRRFALLKFP